MHPLFPPSAQNYEDPRELDNFFLESTRTLIERGLHLRDYLCGSVLDVGCGCGYMVKHQQERGIDCYGIDCDPERVYFAKSIAKHPEKITEADARHMPFKDNHFDLVTSTMLYNHQGINSRYSRALAMMYQDPENRDAVRAEISSHRNQPVLPNCDGVVEENRHAIKEEILRVLRPGGLYLVFDAFDFNVKKFFQKFERLPAEADNEVFITLRKPTLPTQSTK